MEAKDRNEVTELLASTAWTSQDLEEKHGVRSSVELFLQLIIQLTWESIQYNLIVFEKICWLGSSVFIFILCIANS